MPASTSSVKAERVAQTHGPGSVIDSHVHVFFTESPHGIQKKATPAKVVALLDDSRLDKIATIVIAPKGDIEATRKQNDQLFTLVKANPRLIPVASVHPLDGESALDEMKRVKGLGAKMLKIHQNTQAFDLAAPEVGALMKKAGELGLPVLLEGTFTLDPKTMGKVLELALQNPKTKVVMAHMGAADFRQVSVVAILSKYEWFPRNIYFDVSATVSLLASSPDAEMFAWTIRQVGVDRVMFGSDFPLETPNQALKHFDRLGFSAEESATLLKGTATELLGL
jgi:predicted TIM-barrel fold metal-dependent hydrolase